MNTKSRSTPKGRLLPKGCKNHKDSHPPPGGSAARKQEGHCTLSSATAQRQGCL